MRRVALLGFFFALAIPALAQTNGYGYYRAITIDHTKVPNTDQTDFPVLISGSYSYLATTGNGGNVTSSNGYDIIFTSDAAGTQSLPYEREAYNPSSGAVVFWVQVPTLSHTTDTVIYMWYGNSSVTTDQSNSTSVWGSNYLGVWHFPDGTILSTNDSTANDFVGISHGVTATNGLIDGAGSYSGSSAYISVTSGPNVANSSFSVSGWAMRTATNTWGLVLTQGSASTNHCVQLGWNTTNNPFFGFYGNDLISSVSNTDSAWHFFVGTFNSSTGARTLYFDGSQIAANTSANYVGTGQMDFGTFTCASGFLKGSIDEVRVSNTVLSSDWIATEYSNQSDPFAFYSVGSAGIPGQSNPDITSLSPTSGTVGTSVTITGTNFGSTQGSSTVTFNGTVATPTSWSSTTIVVPVPSGASSGNVVVSVGGVASEGMNFDVVGSLAITALSSTSGEVGSSVMIEGTGFGATQGSSTVTFNGTTATPTSWNAATIVVPVPSGATTGNVIVTVSGVASNGVNFTVLVSPSITSLSVTSGVVGTSVTITGTSFGSSEGSSTVTFNGTTATPTSWSTSSIVVAVPLGAATGNVVVTVSDLPSNAVAFTVFPNITSLSPTSGGANTFVTISGSGFGASQGTSTVAFNGVTAIPTQWGGITIVVPVPSNATTGPVIVTVGGNASNGVNFVFSGMGGVAGTVTRASDGSPVSGATIVILQSGSEVSTTSSGTGTYAVGSLAPGVYDVQVSATGLSTQTQTANFVAPGQTITVNIALTGPTILTLSPSSGPIGSPVAVAGSGFGVRQGNSSISFNGVVAPVSSWTNTEIVAAVPSGATSGPVVVTASGAVSNGVNFTVGTGSIGGTITRTSDGTAVSGALVEALLSNVSKASATSGSDGSYTIVGLAPGTYDVRVSAASFGTAIQTSISVSVGSVSPANVALSAAGTISGTVMKADGITPVVGATVTVDSGTDTAGSTTTDTTGSYSVGTVTAGTYSVAVSASGFNSQTQGGISVTSGNTTTVNFTLGGQSSVTYSYDALSRLVGVSDSQNQTAVYSYDSAGNLLSITNNPSSQASIIDFLPGSGPAGTNITISGTAFSATGNQDSVSFNGTAAAVVSATTTQIVATVPAGATTGPISVTAPAGSATSATNFIVTARGGGPTITGFTPAIGTVGTAITINGTNFDSTASNDKIRLNLAFASPTSATSTTLATNVPAGSTSGHISLTTPTGRVASTSYFYVPPSPYQVASVGPMGSIVMGGSANAVFSTAGKIGLFVFDGVGGQRVSLAMSDTLNGCCVTVSILTPSSGTLISTNFGNPGFTGATTLPTTGTYTILIVPNSTQTGTVTLNLYSVLDITGAIAANGNPLTGTITTPGQNAYYTFSGTAGQQVSLNMSDSFNGCCTTLSILDPDSATLASIRLGNPGYMDTTTLPVTGTYTVELNPDSTLTGGFTLNLYTVTNVTGTITADGTPVNGTITTPGQSAYYTFSGTAGQQVSLNMSDNFNGNTTLSILNPDSTTLASIRLGNPGFMDTTTLPVTGTYTVDVNPDSNLTGHFTLNLYTVTNITGTITADGTPVNGTITAPGQGAYYTFSGTAGQQVSLNMSDNFGGNTTLSILNPDSTTLASIRLGNPGFMDTTTLPVTGTYTVDVNPDSSLTGQFTLNLYTVTNATGAITLGGTPQTVNITTPGQNAYLTFTATAGQRVSLQMTSVSISSANVSIQNPTLGPLSAGQSYSVQMEYFQSIGGSVAEFEWSSPSTAKEIIPQSQLTPPNGASGSGLEGDYFNQIYLRGAPNLTRTDSTVNFNWHGASPGGSLPSTNFSARWTGQIQPQYSEQYTFCTSTDDGARLWVNGLLIIDHWVSQSQTEWCSNTPTNLAGPKGIGTSGGYIDTVTIPVTGTYTVLVDPQGTATGSMTLTLNDVLADYTASITPGGTPLTVSTSTPGQNAEVSFSATAGQRVSLQMSGVTMSSSNVSILNPTLGPLVSGQLYPIEMDYFQSIGASLAQLSWTSPSTPGEEIIPETQLYPPGSPTASGLEGDYFPNTNLSGTPTLTRTDPTVNFNWNGASPGGSLAGTNFSVRWTGQIQAQYSEQYTFCTNTDDGTRLWVNGILVVNQWVSQSATEWCSGPPTDLAGPVNVGTSGGFIDTVTIPLTATYTILVDPQSISTGNMTLTLNNVPPDSAGSITLNGSATTVSTTTPGQNAEVTFSGSAGQLATVQLTSNGIGCVNVSLLPPGGGATLVSTSQCGTSFNLAQKTLPSNGTYTIYIDPQNTATGSITVGATSP